MEIDLFENANKIISIEDLIGGTELVCLLNTDQQYHYTVGKTYKVLNSHLVDKKYATALLECDEYCNFLTSRKDLKETITQSYWTLHKLRRVSWLPDALKEGLCLIRRDKITDEELFDITLKGGISHG